MAAELVIARNPDPASTLGFLLRLPLGDGLVFRTSDTWPRTKALYCHPVDVDEWPGPAELEIVERVALRSCARRGAAIDVVLDRNRENRSQIVFTRARGREMVFWQSPRTRKQARPDVRTPTARAAGVEADLDIVVDAHERYAYRFGSQQVRTVTRALPAGDYGVVLDGTLVASVERKSLSDLISSVTSGRLRFALGELAALPRAAIVVEDRWSQIFKTEYARPAQVADALAELQVRWPSVPLVYCETRPLAEEWTYRFLAAALQWARDEHAVGARIPGAVPEIASGRPSAVTPSAVTPSAVTPSTATPEVSTAAVRAWARGQGIEVPDRGRLRPGVWQAYREAHPVEGS